MLTRVIVVIILQYIRIINHYVTSKTNIIFYVNYVLIFFFKDWQNRFPGGPVVKNSPCSTGDAGLIPNQGTKIPHAAGQLSPLTATSGLACHNKRSHVLQRRPDAT